MRQVKLTGKTITGKTISRKTDKAATSLLRWATTDHTGLSRRLNNMPDMGIGDTLKYILMQFLCTVVMAVVSGIWVFVLIAIGIPYFLFGSF